MCPGTLLFIKNDDWDIWFHADYIGRVYESEFVPELQPVIVLDSHQEASWEGSELLHVFKVISPERRFWIAKKYHG